MSKRRGEGGGADEETFLGRWSRRKAEARAERPAEDPVPVPTDAAGEPPVQGDAEQAIRPQDLPDIDSLTAASDFKVFMQKGVPEELRTLALRKLWRLKPSLANLDGLLEYGGDYTRPAVGMAAIKSAYQVGRGYLQRDEEATRTPSVDTPVVEHDRSAEPSSQATGEGVGGSGDLPVAGAGEPDRSASSAPPSTAPGGARTAPGSRRPLPRRS